MKDGTIICIVELWEFEHEPPYKLNFICPLRAFLTEQAAREYALSQHPDGLSVGFTYTYPDDGTVVDRIYSINYVVYCEE